jgi:hypothetical protein
VRYEAWSGYPCVYDTGLGPYCYATLIDGEFVSTGVSIAQPPPDGVRRHLKEAQTSAIASSMPISRCPALRWTTPTWW